MRFLQNSFRTVCIPAKNFTFFADVSDGKFLRYRFLEETDPAAALLSAKAAGFSGKPITLAVTFSDFRVKLATFPDMPEDELASTLQWEQDVLFSLPEPEMRTHILSHSPDGYRILAAAIPKETLSRWQDAARNAGKRIAHILPVFLPKTFPAPGAVFLCGHSSARVLLGGEDGTLTTKTVKISDEETLQEILENAPDLLWCPMTDCEGDVQATWHEIFTKKEIVSRETFQKELYLSLALRLVAGDNSLDFAAPQDACGLLTRLTKGCGAWAIAAGISFLLFGAAAAEYVWQTQSYQEALARQATLSDARAAMQKTREVERTRKAEMEECRLFFAERGDWQKKLVTLADVLPAGATITAIEGERDIQIRGTATKSEDVNTLARLLSLSWDQNVRRESVKREEGSALLKFTLRTEKEAPREDNKK